LKSGKKVQGGEKMRDKVIGGILGFVVGDAIGVPVEFQSRDELKANPVVSMRSGGSHGQPKGTWSDDSSMTLCTMESLTHGLNLNDICTRFRGWVEDGYMTAHGEMFDIGRTTLTAIRKFARGTLPLECGESGEYDNGNGSLMRILPLAFYTLGMKPKERFETVHNISMLTHAHERSLMACDIYVQLACELLKGYSKEKAYRRMIDEIKPFYQEETQRTPFQRILGGTIVELSEPQISSSGYVVDTLEAAIWCFLTTDTYADCVLKAVNLGDDTDTVGAVAGGLAGILYGSGSIPKEWLSCIAKKDDIISICRSFSNVCKPFAPLYEYIPYMECKPGYQWITGKQKNGVMIMPYPHYDETLAAFTRLPYELGFMDYSYHETIEKYGFSVGDGLESAIKTANIELTLAILTAYIRGERFCDGLWGRCVKDGIFHALLCRLKELEM
jgi:ADP-ribosylglycohydrolase